MFKMKQIFNIDCEGNGKKHASKNKQKQQNPHYFKKNSFA